MDELLRIFSTITLAFSFIVSAQAEPHSDKAQKEIQAAVSSLFPSDLNRTIRSLEKHPHPKLPDVFTVLLDDGFWFKSLRIVGFQDGKIAWSAAIDPQSEWGDHSILSAEWKELTNIGITILEVYTSTHRGNGEYIVFLLRDRKLEKLLAVRSIGNLTVGSFAVHVERRAKIISPKKGSFEQIEINGSAQYSVDADDLHKIVKTEPLRQVFLWSPEKKLFEDDVKMRKGSLSFLYITY